MSPTPPAVPAADEERTELLGSLTTQQQQRTSARVIKKLRLEPANDREKRGKRPDGQPDDTECETPNKIDDKDPLKFPTTVKQRMPKALWSTDEKSLFFEALNEYGKDFDAITAYICAKMKKKGMSDNLKTKTQVSHFYYRTWHKLSKHVHFDENVKKVAQELYALINYGELRKKLVSVSEKTCARLGDMVRSGSLALRVRGRTVRVRTPMCRALRRLNQINERACGARVWSRAQVVLRARSGGAWARVQAAAHNPRAAIAAPLSARLANLLAALERRWGCGSHYKSDKLLETISDPKCSEDIQLKDDEVCSESRHTCADDDEGEYLGDHLNLEPDRIIMEERKLSKKPVLHVGPRPGAEIHLPVVSPSEQLSSQKICFSSYLERMGKQRRDKDGGAAKIRTTKRQRKDSATDVDTKKIKIEDEQKLMHIDETAIDGIDLMATYKNLQEEEEKPSTEDEKELKTEELVEEEVDGSGELLEKDKYMSEREKDSFSEMEDDEKYNKSDTDNESDQGKTEKSGKEQKFKNLKVKFRIRPKKRGGSIYTVVVDKDQDQAPSKDDEPKADVDVDTAMRQIRKGWSVNDAGDLTIGDLYLMFGSRARLELDYWWAEPTPPLPQPLHKSKIESIPPTTDKEKQKSDKTEKGTDSSVEDERDRARESDNELFSPKNTFSQDSNDGMSGDERKSEQLASPDHKSSSSGTLKLVSKLINRPQPAQTQPNNGFSQLSDRMKRLLALAGNPLLAAGSAAAAYCSCAVGCALQRKQKQQTFVPTSRLEEASPSSAIFRHPTPIAPRPDKVTFVPTSRLDEARLSPAIFRHPTPIAPRPDKVTFVPTSRLDEARLSPAIFRHPTPIAPRPDKVTFVPTSRLDEARLSPAIFRHPTPIAPRPDKVTFVPTSRLEEASPSSAIFRHPTPIAPRPDKVTFVPTSRLEEASPSSAIFRHPTPIAPRPDKVTFVPTSRLEEASPSSAIFRHPTPIAPRPDKVTFVPTSRLEEASPSSAIFRHPTPIAPRPDKVTFVPTSRLEEASPSSAIFRHPTPIAPRPDKVTFVPTSRLEEASPSSAIFRHPTPIAPRPDKVTFVPTSRLEEASPSSAIFRHPTPIAPRPDKVTFVPTSRLEEASPSSAIFRHPTPIAPRPDKVIFVPTSRLEEASPSSAIFRHPTPIAPRPDKVTFVPTSRLEEASPSSAIFRHPTPIAPRPDKVTFVPTSRLEEASPSSAIFRHPTPIAPRPDKVTFVPTSRLEEASPSSAIFRHPTPIAPRPDKVTFVPTSRLEEASPSSAIFRHPTPIAPRPDKVTFVPTSRLEEASPSSAIFRYPTPIAPRPDKVTFVPTSRLEEASPSSAIFRHPTPIAPRPDKVTFVPTSRLEEASPSSAIFRHPTPIAPRPDKMSVSTLNLDGMPRWRRGRPRLADRRVVVQRLLPLLPKLPPPSNLIPVKIVPNSPPTPPRILPKPPPTSTSDLSFFYVLSESNGQFYFHDGDRRIPITPLQENGSDQQTDDDESIKEEELDSKDNKTDITIVEHPVVPPRESAKDETEPAVVMKSENSDLGHFLPAESLSLSPSRLLRDADGWLEGSVQDFSLSSFLGHLEGRPQPDLAVDSQLQSLMAESSVDYVAKFADLAAEVTDEHLT
ncbi:cramped chromatin regulator [Aphomia sociella]